MSLDSAQKKMDWDRLIHWFIQRSGGHRPSQAGPVNSPDRKPPDTNRGWSWEMIRWGKLAAPVSTWQELKQGRT